MLTAWFIVQLIVSVLILGIAGRMIRAFFLAPEKALYRDYANRLWHTRFAALGVALLSGLGPTLHSGPLRTLFGSLFEIQTGLQWVLTAAASTIFAVVLMATWTVTWHRIPLRYNFEEVPSIQRTSRTSRRASEGFPPVEVAHHSNPEEGWTAIVLRNCILFCAALNVPFMAITSQWRESSRSQIVAMVTQTIFGYLLAYATFFVFALAEKCLLDREFLSKHVFPFEQFVGRIPNLALADVHPVKRAIKLRIESVIKLLYGPVPEGGEERLSPGLPQLLFFWALFSVLYFVYYLSAFAPLQIPPETPTSFAVIIYLQLIIVLTTVILSEASYFLDRYGVPAFGILIAWWFAMALVFRSDHFYALNTRQEAKASGEIDEKALREWNETPPSASAAFADWKFPAPGGQRTMVVVTASGGGIHAEAWVAKVLTGLDQGVPGFGESIGAISGVSGGSLGMLAYTRQRPDRKNDGTIDSKLHPTIAERINRLARLSSLEPAAWGLAFPDLLRTIFPPLVRAEVDRGWAMEWVWEKRFRPWPDVDSHLLPQTIKDASFPEHWSRRRLREDTADVVSGRRPLLIFNSTIVETGQRMMISPVIISGSQTTSKTNSAAQGVNFLEVYPDSNPNIVTAARLSATFSYVSPTCRPLLPLNHKSGDQPAYRYHLADGGYVDNEGIVSAVQLVQTMLEQYRTENKSPFDRLLLVRLIPFEGPAEEVMTTMEKQLSGILNITVGPVTTLATVRTSSQPERGNREVELLKLWLGQISNARLPLKFETVTFQFKSPNRHRPPPLSWQLTERQMKDLDECWETDPDIATARKTVMNLFSNHLLESDGLRWERVNGNDKVEVSGGMRHAVQVAADRANKENGRTSHDVEESIVFRWPDLEQSPPALIRLRAEWKDRARLGYCLKRNDQKPCHVEAPHTEIEFKYEADNSTEAELILVVLPYDQETLRKVKTEGLEAIAATKF